MAKPPKRSTPRTPRRQGGPRGGYTRWQKATAPSNEGRLNEVWSCGPSALAPPKPWRANTETRTNAYPAKLGRIFARPRRDRSHCDRERKSITFSRLRSALKSTFRCKNRTDLKLADHALLARTLGK